jgi:murein DD-endopeptidase MepM/ murein hydrolase activator NlpD
MADGTIARVATGENGGAGNLMVITYGGGYESTYMHGLAGNPFIVTSGQVRQGQPVFRVGTTGRSSGNHLHLKFTLNGTYCLLSKVGIDVLNMGLPVRRYNSDCDEY